MKLSRNQATNGWYEPASTTTSISRLVALVAIAFVAGLLVVPGYAQAATTAVNSVITDPLKDTLQARVDTHGNLAVATASQPVAAQTNLTIDPQIGLVFGTVYTVPANKRLHIQYLMALVTASSSIPTPQMSISTQVNGASASWFVETPNPSPDSSGPGFTSKRTDTVVDLWADPNTQVSVAISAHTTLTTQALGTIEISGVLTDATAGVPVGATTQ